MNKTTVIVFLCTVFAAAFVLMLGLTSGASGSARMRRTLQRRLDKIGVDAQQDVASIVREKFLTSLTPLERQMEELPYMDRLAVLREQAGRPGPAYQSVSLALMLALGLSVACGVVLQNVLAALVGAVVGLVAPFIRLSMLRKARMSKIEEQLPDALDVIKRALRAGHPFNTAVKLVAEDMDGPLAKEFEQTFADLNFGNDVRRALLGLLNRVPTVTMMAVVTSVLVQRETGGNLAEVLDQISKVVRGRFKFDRKVRSLSAEGRMSAWVLAMVPVFLVIIMSITSPNYLPVLLTNPLGVKLLYAAGTLGILGILWIRKIIRIEV